ncbi:hypothetical protein C8K30_105188 [Promicromonospora sp. AC04]|uniref:hypothetical protein n=1 Tax=Promicromonospora sp. AC04 TaxID=2135723 RepID=UPI000D359AD5|nr:hypothetical protein [Promicromonospora sp. AC04]PUB26960.1 hypothetical protein C8K30_105188 [Promicromonospora sp. AC04]
MTWPRPAVPAVLLALLLAGCAESATGAPPTSVPSPTATTTHGNKWPDDADMDQPPPFEVRYDDEALVLYPYTFCYDNGCADGFDEDPPSIGSPARIYVHVAVAGFSELAVSQVAGDYDDPDLTVEADAEPLGNGWWLVTPRGPADTYLVELFASGDGAGDMVADVRWETP